LHWVLDIDFHEDASQVCAAHAIENIGFLRHMALNLLKLEETVKAVFEPSALRPIGRMIACQKVLSG